MANTFKNTITADVGTSEATIYTVPSSTTSVIIGLSLSNTSISTISATVTVTDTSAGTTANLIKNVSIPASSSLVVVGNEQRIVMETTDVLKVTSSEDDSIDVVLSRLDVT